MPGEIDLYEYFQIIRKRRLIIVIVFLVLAMVNFFYLGSQPKFYVATARVKVSERKTLGGLLTEWITWTPGDPMASQATVAKSFPVVERVVKKLNMVSPNATEREISDKALLIQARIETVVEKNTNIISVSFTDNDADTAVRIANAVVESYIEENLLEKNKEARRVREFIQGQLKELKGKLESSEEALKKFKEMGEASGIAVSLQGRLADLEAEKARLLRLYTQRHPDVMRIKDEEALLKEQLKTIPEQEFQYARLLREFEINEKTYKSLQEKFEEARIAEIEKMSDISLVDPAFVSQEPVTRKNVGFILGVFAALIISFTAGFVSEQLDTSIGTIEGIESFVKLPVLGIIPYLRVEGEKEKSREKRRRLEAKTKSKARANRVQSQLLIYYAAASPVLEAYKILRANILMDVFKGTMQNKSILISSAGPEEGKSITCVNLAIAMAQAGNRVLLIDADLRRTSIYRIFGFGKENLGLTDILRKTTPIEPVIKTFSDLLMCGLAIEETLAFPGIDNLNILLAGTLPNLPSELLSSKEINSLLETLKNKYDVVLVDTPPILAVADTLILAPHVDAVILVYKVGKTAKNAIMRAKAQLEAVNAPCKGVVLNNISRQVEMRSEYYYHYKRYGDKKA